MSVGCMSEVFKRYPSGGGEMLLALSLADHADDQGGSIFPSVARLAKMTRQSERAVQLQLKRMRESGWLLLVAEADCRRPNEYRINPEWLSGGSLPGKVAQMEAAESDAPTEEVGVKNLHSRGEKSSPLGVNVVRPRGERRSPNPFLENHQEEISLPGSRARESHPAIRTRVPADYQPDETVRFRLHTSGCPPPTPDQIAAFIAHYQGEGRLAADWGAKFVQWCIREKGFAGKNGGQRQEHRTVRDKRSATMAALTGMSGAGGRYGDTYES